MAKTPVRTWADSFGMWHAEVLLFTDSLNTPSTNAIRSRARRAIIREINERQGEPCTSLSLVLESKTGNDGTVYAMTFGEAF